MSTHRKLAARVGATVTATSLLVLATAGIASAHVTAHSPDNPAKGGDAEITFRVPNEEATANAVKLRVNFSTTSPITNADLEPVPGWTAHETMMTLPKPVHMDNEDVTTAVQSITWTATSGGGIAPGQFQEFAISVEGLPDNTNTLVMPAIQTYANGDVINWDQPTVAGQAEPEHPAPNLALAPVGSADGSPVAATAAPQSAPPAAATSDDTARWLGGIGIVIAALGLGFGLGAFVRGRRGPGAGGQQETGPATESNAESTAEASA
jgi:uncharacterized protein YcnI